jgi:16S rRNA A1518/A1519 N6-dimethyltransferase RsmA/KsgA/DIM1 with predicted DNA glycosylase/AP lyase activity
LWPDLRTFSLALKESDIDPMMRAQDISLEKYSKLFNLLNGQKTT